MTIRQLFKKVETYNEIAKKIGAHEIEVNVTFDYYRTESFSTFRSFKMFTDKELLEQLAEAILTSNRFEIGEKAVIEWDDNWDWSCQTYVEIYLQEVM